jgi:hypothetical protein
MKKAFLFAALTLLSVVLTMMPLHAGDSATVRVRDGRVEEFVNGSLRRTYGSDVVRVQVSGGSVFANLKSGRTAEYVNGSLRRTF